MRFKIITPPETEPVTLAEAKLHLKVDGDEDDEKIPGLITAAREYCENYTRRALALQTFEGYLNRFPIVDYVELPRPPLKSVTSVIIKEATGAETTMTADVDYHADLESTVGRIILPYGKSWPDFTPFPSNPIRIRFAAGYTSEEMPKLIKQAMLLLIGHWHMNREAVLIGSISKEIEISVKTMLTMYRVVIK